MSSRLEELLSKYPTDELGRRKVPKREVFKIMQKGYFLASTSDGSLYTDWDKFNSSITIARPVPDAAAPKSIVEARKLIADGHKLILSSRRILSGYQVPREKQQPPTRWIGNCRICHAHGPIYRHHLKPKCVTRRLKLPNSSTIGICFDCHTEIHRIPNARLADEFSTLNALIEWHRKRGVSA